MFEPTARDGVLRVARPGTRWLSTGWDGGFALRDAAYNVSVPDGFERTDLDAYVAARRARAGFDAAGPALLTGVDVTHARGARSGPVTVYATAGLSNPAALPVPPADAGDAGPTTDASAAGHTIDGTAPGGDGAGPRDGAGSAGDPPPGRGTVNLVVGTDRPLGRGGQANLVAVAAEAKAATLLAATGFPGTTTDAVIAGCEPGDDPAAFTGSATAVGAAVRACVRDAVRASLRSRYPDREFPPTVADATYGVTTDRRAEVFEP